jgi:hypothetical protein
MSEREDLLFSVANEIKGYRVGELPEPTPDHVDRWLRQFTEEKQLPFLREFDHVIKQTFITEQAVMNFLRGIVNNRELVGRDAKSYWLSANFLSIQQNGNSQKEMLKLFSKCLREELGIDLSQCGVVGGDYIYLDDVIFSGNRVKSDLENWVVNSAPQSAKVQVIVAGYHTLGQYNVKIRLNEVAERLGKNISFEYWRVVKVENRKIKKDSSEVLWPTSVPNVVEVQAYMAIGSRFPFEPRVPIRVACEPFSSEEGRHVLEQEFFIAGAKIRAKSEKPKDVIRPLGFSPFGVGFGSMIVSYRNCPNNCPLAMWWGDPQATSGALHWYPLLPRTTYSSFGTVFDDLSEL